ncbi:MAG: AbrB/MazE/SpoVT family DNA-binding domain-containing protein [Methanothrix harundinacea]|jgi:AbrB family looped-hinge helix DNA binding protein|nr:AbrB/MazE/SpoVT family DNA-binding domain-containing protein [Methanothrix harundinacea]
MQATVKVTRNGQVSIPSTVRDVMGIKEGDVVVIDVLSIVKKGRVSSEEGNGKALSTA